MRWLHIAEMGELPPFVQWLSRNSWVAVVVVLTSVLLAAVPRRWLFANLASQITLHSQRVKGWTIILILILGTTAWVGLLIPRLIDPLDSVPEWLPPLLLAVVVVLLSWLWLRDGVIRRVAAVVVALIFLLSTAHWLNGEAIIFVPPF